jgi:hypothetical protein
MARAKPKVQFDRELLDLPAPLRRREYMMRVEAVIFAASQPVTRETLAAWSRPSTTVCAAFATAPSF